jgi:CRISPR system Cascade subunit CasB
MTEASSDLPRRFVGFLEKLVNDNDRAALAVLRRGLGKQPGEVAGMHRYVIPWLPENVQVWHEEPYYLVASLFAHWHQGRNRVEDNPPRNLGASFTRLAPLRAENRDSTEKRFIALLNCHRDDLPGHLRHAVGLLKSKDIPIDWAHLLIDIQNWIWESRSVQRAWARAFWGAPSASATAATEAENIENAKEVSHES